MTPHVDEEQLAQRGLAGCADEPIRIREPRRSSGRWSETVRGTSEPWREQLAVLAPAGSDDVTLLALGLR